MHEHHPERAAFEAWVTAEWGTPSEGPPFLAPGTSSGDGDYANPFVDSAWDGWKKRAAKAVPGTRRGIDDALLEDIDRQRAKIHKLADVVRRIRAWDVLNPVSGDDCWLGSDAAYWRKELDDALAFVPPEVQSSPAAGDAEPTTAEDMTREQLLEAYEEECSQYGHVCRLLDAEREKKADATLTARIAELEGQLATVNERLTSAQEIARRGAIPASVVHEILGDPTQAVHGVGTEEAP